MIHRWFSTSAFPAFDYGALSKSDLSTEGLKALCHHRIILVSSYLLSLSFIPTLNLLINVRTLMIMKMYTLPPPPSLK